MTRKRLKVKRRDRLKHKRKKAILSLSILCTTIILISLAIYTFSVKNQLKELSYAIEYYFTDNSIKDERLDEIENYNLIFSDDSTAIVEVYGTSYSDPEANTIVKKMMKRNKNGKWQIQN